MASPDVLKYWVGFSSVPGIGRIRISQLIDRFGSLAEAWKASESELRLAVSDSRSIDALLLTRSRLSLEAEMEKLARHKVQAIPCEHPCYPSRLKEIHDYPPVLYVRGTLPPEGHPCVAVVGTRRPTIYGRQVAEEMAADLARNDTTIVSGLARGVDSIAHQSALECGGKTIAVLASGLDIIYPAENLKLAQHIMASGALVSEYPLGVRPRAENFPLRNRIMSGLSLGVLVVEAGERSGALITALQALEQNREVFAIPGSILSPTSKGTNRLIQEGAKLVCRCADILEELNLSMVAPRQLEIKEFAPANEAESGILEQLSPEPSHIDEICRSSGLTMPQVSSTLAMLELKGVVKRIGNMNYVRSQQARAE
jgi:DNA processing protein